MGQAQLKAKRERDQETTRQNQEAESILNAIAQPKLATESVGQKYGSCGVVRDGHVSLAYIPVVGVRHK